MDAGAGLTEVVVSARGRQVRTVRAGTGPTTVVFESGLSACASEWVTVQRMVAQGTATLAYDRAGYGGSDPADDPRRLADLADDLEAVLDASGVDGPVVLVGHSWGGPVLRTFLTTTTRPVAGVLLVDGTVSAVMTPSEARKARAAFGLMARVAPLGLHRPLMRRVLTDAATGVPAEDAALGLRDMLRPRDARASAAEARGLVLDQPGLGALEAATIHGPLTFLMGARPDRGQVAMRETFVAATRAEADRRSARFVLAAGSSHFVPGQQPQLVADEALRLLG